MTARIVIFFVLCAAVAGSWAGSCVVYRAAEMGARIAPLDPRHFDSPTIITVGTGGAYENPHRAGPCTAVAAADRIVLVDAGRGVAEALRLAEIPVSQPDTLLLTSLLPENTVGLDDLLFTGWLTHREEPLRVIGPVGTRDFTDALQAAYHNAARARGTSLALPEMGGRLEVLEVGDGWTEQREGLTIRAGALDGGPLPALAWRFEVGARSLVVGGTGWDPDGLVEFADHADALLHEAVFVPEPEDAELMGITEDPERLRRTAALHTSIADVGGLARRAGVDRLILVRLRPPPAYDFQITGIVSGSFDGAVEVAEDGDEFDL